MEDSFAECPYCLGIKPVCRTKGAERVKGTTTTGAVVGGLLAGPLGAALGACLGTAASSANVTHYKCKCCQGEWQFVDGFLEKLS